MSDAGNEEIARGGPGWSSIDLQRTSGSAALYAALERAPGNVVVLWMDAAWRPSDAPDLEGLLWIERFERPTLFAAAGELSGAALDIALACDMRIGADSLVIGEPAANQRRLAVLLGARDAPQPPIGAAQALRAGLVSAVVPADGLAAEAARLAGVVASRGPIATRFAKEAVWRGLEMPLAQGLRFETDLTLLLQTTKDRAEGVEAFIGKRPPNFTGE